MRRAAALIFPLCFVLACALLPGCAAPGEPSPRRPVAPTAVTDLAASQSGEAVMLRFSLPRQSTNREPLEEPPTIEIYRANLAEGVTLDRRTPWHLLYTIPAERVGSYARGDRFDFRDPLPPAEFERATGSRLAYMVRTRTSGRSSSDSNYLVVHVYPAPAAPHDVRASVSKSAIHLTWTPPSSEQVAALAGYHIYRAELEPGGSGVQRDTGEETPAEDLSQLQPNAAMELAGSPSSPEFQDTHFEFGRTYRYVVRTLDQFGPDVVESADSAPVVVSPRNTFAPAAPVGLEAAVIPATPRAPAYVELSWAISPEEDLAGYNVYRSDREDTTGERMNSGLLPSPTFRDISVVSGRNYFYRVSAVDHAGNESQPSSAIRAEIALSEH